MDWNRHHERSTAASVNSSISRSRCCCTTLVVLVSNHGWIFSAGKVCHLPCTPRVIHGHFRIESRTLMYIKNTRLIRYLPPQVLSLSDIFWSFRGTQRDETTRKTTKVRFTSPKFLVEQRDWPQIDTCGWQQDCMMELAIGARGPKGSLATTLAWDAGFPGIQAIYLPTPPFVVCILERWMYAPSSVK